ncbi:hypothetical protein Pcinc_001181 [Petrolisthes cinctipes]|uniref:Uncharacterized protein n=1 Tax=Petrolisthes cinctipes TaxID=88211 RepID=A0AAE1L3K6_PETCI|nr:hypothetical protein Pcinc_001181 [Petrolisthes cinctipes]
MEQDPRAPTVEQSSVDDPPDFPMELESSIEDPALQDTDLQPEAPTGSAITTKVTLQVKELAVQNLFKPASAIVDDVLLQEMGNTPCPSRSLSTWQEQRTGRDRN